MKGDVNTDTNQSPDTIRMPDESGVENAPQASLGNAETGQPETPADNPAPPLEIPAGQPQAPADVPAKA